MISLLMEYRISDLSDAAEAINSYFIERSIDFSGNIYLYDVVAMKDPKTIYEVFLSDSLLKMLYLKGSFWDLDNIPDDFVDLKNNMTISHYFSKLFIKCLNFLLFKKNCFF